MLRCIFRFLLVAEVNAQFAETQFAKTQFAETQFAETQFAESEGRFAEFCFGKLGKVGTIS